MERQKLCFHLYEVLRIGKFTEKVNQGLPGVGGGSKREFLFHANEISVGDDEKVLKTVVTAVQSVLMPLNVLIPLNCTLKIVL